MIGRSDELEELRALLSEARRGRGGFALISAEAGVGKSRFVAAALEELQADKTDQALVATGNCLNELRLLPYAPVADALGVLLRNRAPDEVDPYLRYLLPDLDPASAPLDEEMLDSGAVRHRLGQAVCGLLETVAEESPVCPDDSPESGSPFVFWHPDLVTLHIWLWYPNPDGPFKGTNRWVRPFNDEAV